MSENPPPKKKSNTAKILLGCGLVGLLLLIGGVGGAYYLFSGVLIQDPVEVEKKAVEIVGAPSPDDFEGMVAIDAFGIIQIAILTKNGGYVLIVGGATKDGGPQLEAQMQTNINVHVSQSKGSTEVLSSESFDVGGQQVNFDKVRIKSDGGSNLRYSGLLPTLGDRVRRIIYFGPEAGFDKASLEAYLKSLPGK